MARLARAVVPDTLYHVTHRGSRRDRAFVDDTDRKAHSTHPFPGRIARLRWAPRLSEGVDTPTLNRLRSNTSTDRRPCGTVGFVERMEQALDPILRPQKLGRKPKGPENGASTRDLFMAVKN
jgi:hypothetical protein